MKTDFQLTIIERIKKLRTEHDASQAQIATILEISTGQMGNIETPKAAHKYTLGQIAIICNEYKISVADIFLPKEYRQLSTDSQIDLLIQKIVEYEQ